MEQRSSQVYTDIHITDQARVHLGNNVHNHKEDTFTPVLERLSSLSFESIHRQYQEERHPSTGLWLLDDDGYRTWKDFYSFCGLLEPSASSQLDSHTTLWCPGLPGAGKTFLASWIVDDVRSHVSNNTIVVSFYASHGRQSRQNISAFLSFLARQLIEQRPKAEHGSAESTLSSYLRQRDCFACERLSELICTFASQYDCVFCVVDALDEFSPGYDQRANFVKCLIRLCNTLEVGKLRLCITSRDSSGITDLLYPCTILRIRTPEPELKAYIEERVERSNFLVNSINTDNDLKAKIVDTIIQKSDCIFKLAILQIDHLCLQKNVVDLRKALRNMAVKLDDFYMEALQRIEHNPQASEVVSNLFKWLMRGGDMDSYSLSTLLALQPDLDPEDWVADTCHEEMRIDVSRYVSMSEGLLRHTSNKVSFAHETIRHFLATALALHMDDWCLRSAAAFLTLPRSLRFIEETTSSNDKWMLRYTSKDRCFNRLTSDLNLENGMAWLVPEFMTYLEAHKCLWRRVEERLHLPSTACCVALDWIDHATESMRQGGADLDITDPNGSTTMHLVMKEPSGSYSYSAWFCWDDASFIEAFTSSGYVNMSMRDHSGQTPLHVLFKNNCWKLHLGKHAEIKRYWESLFIGSHCTIRDNDGLTSLHIAVQTASVTAVRMLTRWCGICVNNVSAHGQTPIIWALHTLWACGQRWLAMPNSWKTSPRTSGHRPWWMLRMFCSEMSRILQELARHPDFDPNVVDSCGYTALDWAKFYEARHQYHHVPKTHLQYVKLRNEAYQTILLHRHWRHATSVLSHFTTHLCRPVLEDHFRTTVDQWVKTNINTGLGDHVGWRYVDSGVFEGYVEDVKRSDKIGAATLQGFNII